MNARLECRPAIRTDLRECLLIHPSRVGAERIGLKRAMRAWETILDDTDTCLASLVEKVGPDSKEIVGFGLAVFVTARFAEAVLANPQPGLNARIIESVDALESVIPSYRYLQNANAAATLDHVVMYSSEKRGNLNANELLVVRNQLARAYLEGFAGYRMRRMLFETVDDYELEKVKSYAGIRVVKRLTTPDSTQVPALAGGTHALLEATAESLLGSPDSVAARPFIDRALPILDFSASQKRLLIVALRGAENAELAANLCRTPAAIKRTWAGIFEQCEQHLPALLPASDGPSRGLQKRYKVMTYVREHPEELRPFPKRKSAVKPRAS
jgi:hypothetical protein